MAIFDGASWVRIGLMPSAFSAGASNAQTANSPAARPTSSSDVGVDEIVVTAERRDGRIKEVPFNGTMAFPRNAAAAHIAGLDLDTAARLIDQLDLRFSGLWLPKATHVDYPAAVAYSLPLGRCRLLRNMTRAAGAC